MIGRVRLTMRRRGAATLIGAAGVAALAPGGAGAADVAPCDAGDRGERPALVVRALPSRIAPDRDIPFLVVRAPRGNTQAVYRGRASVATERPQEENFLTEYFLQPADDRELGRGGVYWIRMRAGEAPATVRLTYVNPPDRTRLTRQPHAKAEACNPRQC
jgi:hypothetical protein